MDDRKQITTRPNGRIEWIDCAKGFAILLVIIGHTVKGDLRGAIFSFHMPLFFILSCATYRWSREKEEFVSKSEKAFKHLIFPAVFMFLIVTIISVIQNLSEFTSLDDALKFIKECILTAVFASGNNVPILDTWIPAIGIPWFFVVLFLGRTLFDYMHLKLTNTKLVVWSCILCLVGIAFGRLQWLPLSFDIVLAILPMFFIGSRFELFQVESRPVKKFVIYVVLWLATLLPFHFFAHNYMELACRRYLYFPLCYATALLGTLMVSEFGEIVCKLPKLSRFFIYLGKNSMYMLCIHILDSYLFKPFWELSANLYLNALCRVLVDMVVFGIFMLLRETYIKKKNKKAVTG